jgi:hypothetical protein
MRLTKAEQVFFEAGAFAGFDLCLVGCGYESRSAFLAERLEQAHARSRIALAFTERKVLSRKRNEKTLRKLGYKEHGATGNDMSEVKPVLDAALDMNADRAAIFIDYSCMTRVWYAGILEYFRKLNAGLKNVELFFAYAAASYAKPAGPSPNAFMGPMPGFVRLAAPDRGSALVIGLGYETERALGLVEYVEAASTYAFYTEPAIDCSYVNTVKRNNKLLFDRLGSDRLIPFPLADLRTTGVLLSSLCLGLSRRHRVILAPLGPKPFSLLCLLLAIQFDSLDVWRVSSGQQQAPVDRKPTGDVILCKVTFSSESSTGECFSGRRL